MMDERLYRISEYFQPTKTPFKLFCLVLSVLFATALICREKYAMLGAVSVMVLYFLLSIKMRFVIFTLAALFPLSFAYFGPVDDFRWIEGMAPIFFLNLVFLLRKRAYLPGSSKLFYSAICVIVIWAIINYIHNPVSAVKLLGAPDRAGGLRSYYKLFIGVTVFFSSLWYFSYRKVNEDRWLLLIISFSLTVGLLRLVGYFAGFDIPVVSGTFRFGHPLGLFHRIGGLSEASITAIAAIFAYYYKRKLNVNFTFLLAVCFILLFYSGGRAGFFGVVFALTLYFLLVQRKRIGVLFLSMLLLLILFLVVAPFLPIPHQFKRLFDISGGVARQDLARFHTFQYYWEIFKLNPVFGKGIGYYGGRVSVVARYKDFVSGGLVKGGHGAYYSILAIFGIGGIFFLLAMLLGGIYRSYKLIKEKNDMLPYKKLMVFPFIYLVTLSVEFYTGYTGYGDIPFYFLVGMTAGMASANERIIENSRKLV